MTTGQGLVLLPLEYKVNLSFLQRCCSHKAIKARQRCVQCRGVSVKKTDFCFQLPTHLPRKLFIFLLSVLTKELTLCLPELIKKSFLICVVRALRFLKLKAIVVDNT